MSAARRSLRALAAALLTVLLTLAQPAFSATAINSVRVWPAADYTRVTFESSEPLSVNSFSIKSPNRLVVDIDNIESTPALEALASRISANDPYIRQIRLGRPRPGVVRLVLDLKAEVRPVIAHLKPYGEYQHRMVLDIYPLVPPDPLMAFVEEWEAKNGGPREPEAPIVEPKSRKREPATIRLITVAIDAGHGGEDPGARGATGALEKDVTLSIARKLKEQIDNQPNMRAILIRDGDYFIPLHQRVHKARKANVDLFISVHADAFDKPEANGSSVFALSERGATSAAARWLAKNENASDLMGGVSLASADPDLAHTLLDLSQTATISDSLKLGKAVLSEIGGINRLHKRQVEQAGFAVLKAPDIPSILVETAFISNPEEEQKLSDGSYQERLAGAIVAGIKRYFAKNPPLARSKVAQNDR